MKQKLKVGYDSCDTRHKEGECNCLPNTEPLLFCEKCQRWETHVYADQRRVTRIDEEEKKRINYWEQLYRCEECDEVRVYGFTATRQKLFEIVDFKRLNLN